MSLTARESTSHLPDPRQLPSDEPEMESSSHYQQLALLVSCLEWYWRQVIDYFDFFIGANLSVYYDPEQPRRRAFCGPDLFVVRGVDPAPRNSWMVRLEGGRYPDLIIELLSDSTAPVDRTGKKDLYQNVFRTPEYFWFSPATLEFAGFRLVDGVYQPIPADAQGRRWSEVLKLYLGVVNKQLRYFDPAGALVPTPTEAAARVQQQLEQKDRQLEQERRRADRARQRAEQERQRADKLAQRLRDLGIDPD